MHKLQKTFTILCWYILTSFSAAIFTETSELLYISENSVREVLNWEDTFKAVEKALESVTTGRAVQTGRFRTPIPNTGNELLTMPGYLNDTIYGGLSCKLATLFPGNTARKEPLPNILANIMLFDSETGSIQAVIAGTEITKWRTAAASAVATHYLHFRHEERKNDVLAIVGAGEQGRIHAIAFQHLFNFKQVRIWNRTPLRAMSVAEELNKSVNATENPIFIAVDTVEDCVKNADVIVTATSADSPVVKLGWLKTDVHINAVGASVNHHTELDEPIYMNSYVYIDYWTGAKQELAGLEEKGVQIKGEIGGLISGAIPLPNEDRKTVFQSLGMAVEDGVVARLVYNTYLNKNTDV